MSLICILVFPYPELMPMTAFTTPKILLVDDSAEFLQITGELLRIKAGYQVIPLEKGSRALEVARRENPDVILLDIYMPDAEGPQICRQLKTSPDLNSIPVLFLTAVGSDAQFRARCLEEGGDDFLMKPVDADELIARLRVLLRIKSLQDELRRERDELERKVQERARELKEKETLAAIGKMVAGVAHEIRNPLGAISNSAAVLSRDLVLEGEDLKLMEIIVRESARLRETISDFLTFAHPPPYNFSPVNMGELINDVLFLAKRDSLCGSGVSFRVDLAADVPPVYVDRDRLHQVIWNLIRNALEAVRGEGEVRLVLREAEHQGQKGVVISVVDDGVGIPDGEHEQIFEPFFTRKARGSGLGLAMVQSTVRAHSGAITVKSRQGQGSEFSVWLPMGQADVGL